MLALKPWFFKAGLRPGRNDIQNAYSWNWESENDAVRFSIEDSDEVFDCILRLLADTMDGIC